MFGLVQCVSDNWDSTLAENCKISTQKGQNHISASGVK